MLCICTVRPYHGASIDLSAWLRQAPDRRHRQHEGFAGREVGGTVPPESDYESPFFLSYAHVRGDSAGDADGYVKKFFDDLSDNVEVQISLPADVPVGYMDQTMQGGEEWTSELMHALGTCQILVALLSARYLKSEWCSREWRAFAQRTVRKRPGISVLPSQGCIIPVLWAPLRSPLPGHIKSRQLFSPDREPDSRVPRQYRDNGVFGLMRMGAPNNSYEIVAWQLAKRIADIYHGQQVESREFDPADLRACLCG